MSFQKLIIALLVFAAGEAGLQGQFAQTNSFDGVNMSIPDGDLDGVQDVRNVTSDITQITSVRVRLKISGDFNGDLYVYLRHDDGISSHICVLLNRPGRTDNQRISVMPTMGLMWCSMTRPPMIFTLTSK